jgi:hypothetical protein
MSGERPGRSNEWCGELFRLGDNLTSGLWNHLQYSLAGSFELSLWHSLEINLLVEPK